MNGDNDIDNSTADAHEERIDIRLDLSNCLVFRLPPSAATNRLDPLVGLVVATALRNASNL